MDTPPEVDMQIHSEMRSVRWTLMLCAVTALIAVAPLLPGMGARFGVEAWQTIAVGVFFVTATVGALVTFRLFGRWSKPYIVFNFLETSAIASGTAFLIIASGKPESVYWFIYFGQVLFNSSVGTSRKINTTWLALAPLAVAVAWVWKGELGAALVAVAFGLLGVYLYLTLSRAALRLNESIVAQQEMAAQLSELRVESERARIARDLHDGLGAELSALIHVVREAKLESAAQDVEARVQQSIDELRSIVWVVRCDAQTLGDLAYYVRTRGADLCGKVIKFEFAFQGDRELAIGDTTRNHVLRIALEAVRNSVRHGAPKTVRVELEATAQDLFLRVKDDGHGFDATKLSPERKGGVQNIRQRAQELSGEAKVESSPKGTIVEVRFPYHAHGDATAGV